MIKNWCMSEQSNQRGPTDRIYLPIRTKPSESDEKKMVVPTDAREKKNRWVSVDTGPDESLGLFVIQVGRPQSTIATRRTPLETN